LKSISSFLLKKQTVIIAYILLAIIIGIKQYYNHSFNNYLIYKYTFWHSIDFKNLYLGYPEYNDSNHYGPLFAIFVAPFALLPDGIGMVLWNFINTSILLWGFFSLPLSINKKVLIAWICLHETLTALFSFQFNIALTGLIMLSFSYLIKKKEIQSAFIIAFGTLVKLYGIVGLAFFFFTKNKLKFIIAGLIAFIILFILPMILSSPAFVIQTYKDWYLSLAHKNASNASLTSFQDISLMGMVRRITGDITIPNLPFLVFGLIVFSLPYLRIKQFEYLAFRLMLLASTLIFTVIFSSGSESPTYIIAFAGVAIWFIIQPNPKNYFLIGLLIFAMLLTSLSPTDIFPRSVKEFIRLYSLKALPCVLIWFCIIYQMMKNDFSRYFASEK
jgi:hypothetical protein